MNHIIQKKMSARQTLDVIERFYKECLEFWQSEENAIKSVEGLKYNPYTINSELIHQPTLEKWLIQHN